MPRLPFPATLLAGAAGLAFGTLTLLLGPDPSPRAPAPDTIRTVRAFDLHAAAPDLSRAQVDALLERSDRWTRALQAADPDGDPGASISRAFDAAAPAEAEARAWFDQHPEPFGGRSYRASAFTVDRLMRIERVRAQLDGQAGEPQ